MLSNLLKYHNSEDIAKIKTNFPYAKPTRQQFKMMLTIIRAQSQSKILIQNSTGGGKTISALVGALSRRGEDERIVVFCRTISQISSFLREWKKFINSPKAEAINKIKSSVAPKILPMLGKGKLCRMQADVPQIAENLPSQATGLLCHLLPCKLHPARTKMRIKTESQLIQANIKLWYNPSPNYYRTILFEQTKACPYYLQHALIKEADIVVTTYAYTSDPLLTYLLQTMEASIDELIVVFDEAHNLAESVRQIVTRQDIQQLIGIFGQKDLLLALRDIMGKYKMYRPEEIANDDAWTEMETAIAPGDEDIDKYSLTDLIRPEVLKFKEFIRLRKIGYLIVHTHAVELMRVAPNIWLQQFTDAALQIYMSGTFRPLKVYRRLFGFKAADAYLLDLDEDNEQNKFKAFLSYKGLTSKYEERTPALFDQMAHTILNLYEYSPRHSLVIAPSYSFMQDIAEAVQVKLKQWQMDIPLLIEKKNMQLSDLQRMINYSRSRALIFGVAAGKFSEGVELVRNGNSIISLLIFAGLPFKAPDVNSKAINNIRGNILGDKLLAKDMEFIIPLIQTISQAFGRTIRSENDRGALVILDYRAELLRRLDSGFALSKYNRLKDIINDLDEFFTDYAQLQEVI